MINGVINIYKEQGFTSFDVVAKLRGILKQKKIGHTGTLDPMAEGVLIVCLGNATKLVDMITAGDKCYKATMLLGRSTDTEDVTGNILAESEVNVSDEKIIECINGFVGPYDQIPPMYSAIKKDGKKLYEYARAGLEVERTPRPVNIYSIDNIEINIPYVSFDVHCSKGTYIRSLCRDIGEKLGCYATLSALKRDNVHGFYSKDAYTLNQVQSFVEDGSIMDKILPTESLLLNYTPYKIKPEYVKYLLNGNKLYSSQLVDMSGKCPDEDIIRVYDNEKMMALYEKSKADGMYMPYKMFLDN